MKITKHAQSCFLIETLYSKILIDPGTFVFNEEGLKPENFPEIDVLIFTHEHPDHFDLENVKQIIKTYNPVILGTNIVIEKIREEIPDRLNAKLISTKEHRFSDLSVSGYLSQHGPLPTGATPPHVNGIKIVENDTHESFYSPGDTIKLAETSANVVAVPICGQVVLDIEQAKAELIRVGASFAIPIHYDNPRFPVNVDDFITAMQDTDIETKKLNWGESVEI